jgi:hypothetical protein
MRSTKKTVSLFQSHVFKHEFFLFPVARSLFPLKFFFPEVHQLIDWTQTPQSLDKELQEITASSETEKRIADQLYQVWLLDKREVWILIHVEIQSQYETDFGQRMYIYNYRSFDLYHKPVVSLAVLGDERNNWRMEVVAIQTKSTTG